MMKSTTATSSLWITVLKEFPMRIIENREASGETFVMDDTSFVNCVFSNCKLVYHGGDSAWSGCTFTHCQLEIHGAAAKTALLLRAFGWQPPVIEQATRENLATVN